MPFDGLLGNEQLKRNLAQSISKGHISHFYLLSGPEGSGKHTMARLLAAAILCKDANKPCLRCSACRKVMANTHPDLITVDDPEKKTVPVDLIREARADMYIQPNESDHKIYLFPRAQDMGLPGQNALLKVLEEPPSYGVFLLLADNPNKLLPTVRSRCTELKLLPLDPEIATRQLKQEFPKAEAQDLAAAVSRSGGFLGQAKKLLAEGASASPQVQSIVDAICNQDGFLLLQTLVPMERWKRDALELTLREFLEISENALLCRSGIEVASPLARKLASVRGVQVLRELVLELKQALLYTQSNVSAGAICGYLEWKLGNL